MHQLPVCFYERYGSTPQNIFVRDCYRKLYEIVSDLMYDENIVHAATLFTGIPGIGKSLFLVYFIYRFMYDERFDDNHRFALEHVPNVYTYFEPTTAEIGVFNRYVRHHHTFKVKDFLLLCDMSANVEPVSRAKWTFIFSSPAPGRYQEIMKNRPKFKYIMPTWTEQELMCVDPNIELWNNFDKFGGVPRHVMPSNPGEIDSLSILQDTLDRKGGIIAENFFTYSFGTVDMFQNYMLVHINPPKSDSGEYKYDGRAEYSFASNYVFLEIVNKNLEKVLMQAINIFNCGVASETFGPVTAGFMFEKICLWLKPLNGKIITDSLEPGGEAAVFDVPNYRHILTSDWNKTAELPVDMFIVQRNSYLESGDAFYVTPCDGSLLLVVFQITVASSHPVKISGLHKILMAFPEDVRVKISKKALVFVIPKHGTLDKAQKLHTQNNKEIADRNIPLIAREFKQYVYRHEI